MGSLQNQKRRIKSVSSTLEVTEAMELVSFVKLKKLKEKYEHSKEYYALKRESLVRALNNVDLEEHIDATDRYLIVITSSLGLCGNYNSEVINLLGSDEFKGYKRIVLGSKGLGYFKKENIYVDKRYRNYSLDTSEEIFEYLKNEIMNKNVKSIEIIYTSYKNNFTHVLTRETIYPLVKQEVVASDYLVEVDKESLINIYLKDSIDKALLESLLSENASRNVAMHQASDNASDLKEELILDYNKIRQQQITNELRDIVSGGE